MQQWKDNINSAAGFPLAGATVTVTRNYDGGAAKLYRANGSGLISGNVVETDATGQYAFYARSGRYTLTIQADGYATQTRDIILFDPDETTTYINLMLVGAEGNDTDQDDLALERAITRAKASGRRLIYAPAGLYRLQASSGQFIDADNIAFHGDGFRSSVFRVYADMGDVFTVQASSGAGTNFNNHFAMDSIGIRARVETTHGDALRLNKCQNVTLTNVAIEDFFGGVLTEGGSQHYVTGLHIFSPRATAPVSWPGPKAGSHYLKIVKSSGGHIANELFYSNFNFRRTETSNYVENGIVINAVDGVWLNNGHVMGVQYADMHVEPVAGTEQISGIKANAVWFDNNAAYGLRVAGATSALYAPIELNACNFLTHTTAGIFVDAASTMFEGVRMNGGWVRKANLFGALIRAGHRHIFTGVDWGACNTDGDAFGAAIAVDGGADKVQVNGGTFEQTAFGVTAAAMIGVRVNAGASGHVQVNGAHFDLAAADIIDASTLDTNNYANNTTTKTGVATAVSGSSLVIPEIGDEFLVSDGLNYANLTGRWHGRTVVLQHAGVSVITHVPGQMRLRGGANITTVAGQCLRLTYLSENSEWAEC